MGRRVVLIISSPQDTHAQVLSEWLRKDDLAEPVLFDFHDFPLNVTLTYNSSSSIALGLPGGVTLTPEDISGVWWRRPQDFAFSESITDPAVERFCELNCQHALQGFVEILGDRVIDQPVNIFAADRKVYQLHLAQDCGLTVPATCVTNDPEAARRFIDCQEGSIVYKILRGTDIYYKGTTVLNASDVSHLQRVPRDSLKAEQRSMPTYYATASRRAADFDPLRIASRAHRSL